MAGEGLVINADEREQEKFVVLNVQQALLRNQLNEDRKTKIEKFLSRNEKSWFSFYLNTLYLDFITSLYQLLNTFSDESSLDTNIQAVFAAFKTYTDTAQKILDSAKQKKLRSYKSLQATFDDRQVFINSLLKKMNIVEPKADTRDEQRSVVNDAEGTAPTKNDATPINPQLLLMGRCVVLENIERQSVLVAQEAKNLEKRTSRSSPEKELFQSFNRDIQSHTAVVVAQRQALIEQVIAELTEVASGKIRLQKPIPVMSFTTPSGQSAQMNERRFLESQQYLEENWEFLTAEHKGRVLNFPWHATPTSGTPETPTAKTPPAASLKSQKKRFAARFGVADLVPEKERYFESFNQGHNFRVRWFEKPYVQASIDVALGHMASAKSIQEDPLSTLGLIEEVYALHLSLEEIEKRVEEGRKQFKGWIFGLKEFFYRDTLTFLDKIDSQVRQQRKSAINRQICLAKEIVQAFKKDASFSKKFGAEEIIAKFLEDTLENMNNYKKRGHHIKVWSNEIVLLKKRMNEVISEIRENIELGKQEQQTALQKSKELDDPTLTDNEILKPFLDPHPVLSSIHLSHLMARVSRRLQENGSRQTPFMKKVEAIYTASLNHFNRFILDERVRVLWNTQAKLLVWYPDKVLGEAEGSRENIVGRLSTRYMRSYSELCFNLAEGKLSITDIFNSATEEERRTLFLGYSVEKLRQLDPGTLRREMERMIVKHEEVLVALGNGINSSLCRDLGKIMEMKKNNKMSDLREFVKRYISSKSRPMEVDDEKNLLKQRVGALEGQLANFKQSESKVRKELAETHEKLNSTQAKLDATECKLEARLQKDLAAIRNLKQSQGLALTKK